MPPTCCSHWSQSSPGCPRAADERGAARRVTDPGCSLDAHPDPFGPSGLDGWPSQGTVLRYRDRGGIPDEISAAPSGARGFRPTRHSGGLHRSPTATITATLTARRPDARSGRRGPGCSRRPGDRALPWRPAAAPRPKSAASHPHLTAAYTFPAQRYGSGLVVARRWTLNGKDGTVLTETITLSSATGKTLTTWFKDSIPATIVNGIQTLRFSVIPRKIVNSDPVVEWYVPGARARHGHRRLRSDRLGARLDHRAAHELGPRAWMRPRNASTRRPRPGRAHRRRPRVSHCIGHGGILLATGTRTPTRPTAVIPAWSPATRTRFGFAFAFGRALARLLSVRPASRRGIPRPVRQKKGPKPARRARRRCRPPGAPGPAQARPTRPPTCGPGRPVRRR